MANVKSAKKRVKVAQVKAARNKAIKSKVKTVIKNLDIAIAENNKENAVAALKIAVSVINKASSKGVYHRNTCSRKVARLSKAVSAMA